MTKFPARSARAESSRAPAARLMGRPAAAGSAPTSRFTRSAAFRLMAFTIVSAALAAMAQATLASPPAEARSLRLPVQGRAPTLDAAGPWINGAPSGQAVLDGKVRVVSFWTYSCINCLRTLPALRAWADQYADRGLAIVGVHTPEFAFERDTQNVTRAVRDLKINYPVLQDNDYRLWRAFRNRYWPALYVVDAQGRIRHHQFGEAGLAQTQAAIEALLAEAGAPAASRPGASAVDTAGIGLPADALHLRSPEAYLGHAQARGFVSPGGALADRPKLYRVGTPARNQWGLSGEWTVRSEFIETQAPSGTLVMRFHARDAHLVMGPGPGTKQARFIVTIDGKPPGADHGTDIGPDGRGTLDATRLYQLVRQRGPIDDRTVEVRFLDTGVRAYAFTFG
jgi:thiol-disulfide isomerase/thioredoxin